MIDFVVERAFIRLAEMSFNMSRMVYTLNTMGIVDTIQPIRVGN